MKKTTEQEWLDGIEYDQCWELINKYINKGTRSYADVLKNAEDCKLIYDSFWSEFPETVEIKSVNEIKIGDVLVYTKKPRGTGAFLPKVGERWEMKTQGDIISASIQIIERGRGWWPIKTKTP